jgi:hypothetical protein
MALHRQQTSSQVFSESASIRGRNLYNRARPSFLDIQVLTRKVLRRAGP